jgi:hypothetical protein
MDVYRGNCTGCDLWGEVVLVGLASYFFMLVLRARLLRQCIKEKAPDPHNMIYEMTIVAFVFAPLLILSMVLLEIDPMGLDYDQQAQWEWIMVCSVGFAFYMEGPRQAYLALRERQVRLQNEKQVKAMSVSTKRADILTLVQTYPVVRRRFETFCAQHYCAENARFLADVLAFKEWSGAAARNPPSPEQVLIKAKAICQLYIIETGLLQVNLPSEIQNQILSQVEQQGVATRTSFDAALNEIASMLRWPLWHDFVKLGGLEGELGSADVSAAGTPEKAKRGTDGVKDVAVAAGEQQI